MSSFTQPLVMRFLGSRKWELVDTFTYHVGELGSGTVVTVPCGFITDGASVPRLFWALLDPWGRWAKAAIIHDYLYLDRAVYCGSVRSSITRAEADEVFIEAMAVSRVGWLARHTMYWAVRLFGGIAWNAITRRLNDAGDL